MKAMACMYMQCKHVPYGVHVQSNVDCHGTRTLPGLKYHIVCYFKYDFLTHMLSYKIFLCKCITRISTNSVYGT